MALKWPIGARSGEVLNLEWSRIDFDKSRVYLYPKNQKSRKHGTLILMPPSRIALLNREAFHMEHCLDSSWVFCQQIVGWCKLGKISIV
ncbi:hypothetical protein [Candidatus Venteria ishoeyi]|uniref:hypothetical protein n=1 Tax=Candidatus Venteria ishoeyi TaxID=1899563 RepID=UPI0015A80014